MSKLFKKSRKKNVDKQKKKLYNYLYNFFFIYIYFLCDFKSSEEIINLFKSVGLSYGPSVHVLSTFKEYVQKTKERKDYRTLKYILDIAIKLTDQDYFKKELESLKKV